MSALAPSLLAFFILTIVLGGAAAILSGRAIADAWRAPSTVLFAAVPLAGAARFLHATLADEPTDAPKAFLTFGLMIAFAFLGFALRRRGQMARQYPWLAQKTAP